MRIDIIKRRAKMFLDLASELMNKGILDIAAFHVHQACQLRVKASILRLTGNTPRVHGVRELLGILAHALEELGFRRESDMVMDFTRRFRDVLIDIEASYTEARYSAYTPSRSVVESMYRVVKELFELLDRVENIVLARYHIRCLRMWRDC